MDSTRFITGLRCCTDINYAIPTKDKGILFVGIDFNNPGGIIPYFFDTSGEGNVLIGKIDSNQRISWIKVYGGNYGDGAVSACQTPDGGYAVLATTSSNDGDVTGFHGGNDYWLLRLDASGNILWNKCYGGPGGEQAASIANTPDNGFILLGTTNDTGGDVLFHYGNDFDYDWFVVKTDSAGNKQWVKTVGGTGQEADAGTILSVDTSYYLVSSSYSTDHDCIDTFWHSGVNTGYDYHVLKLSAAGGVQWDSSYGGTNSEDMTYAMFDNRDSTIVIIGSTQSNDYMVTGYQGGGDMWVVKVSRNGTLLWQKALGGINQEKGTGVCEGVNDDYVVYGNTYDGSIGVTNFWLFNLDIAGNEIYNKIFGGPFLAGIVESPSSIIPYLNGYVATGGSTADSFMQGTTYGNFDNDGGAFASYISYWPLSVNNIAGLPKSSLVQFPNPAQDKVTISVRGTDLNGHLSILNSIGQVIYLSTINSRQERVNIITTGWTKGLYLVRWQSEDGMVLTGKLIIN